MRHSIRGAALPITNLLENNMPFDWTWEIDGWIVVAGALCAAGAALLGNFLVLRRMSLMGDAISHAVLPGLAAAFLFTGERQGLFMFLGAAAVGVLTVVLPKTDAAKNKARKVAIKKA